jgi:PKHD-type hydroxylase
MTSPSSSDEGSRAPLVAPAVSSARLCSFASKAGVFTPEECDRIVELGRQLDLQEGIIHTDGGGQRVDFVGRNCLLEWVDHDREGWGWVFERIHEQSQELNAAHWGFEVGPPRKIQYTSYGLANFYSAHFDNGSHETQHRKLSVSIQLTDPRRYWGGALKFWSMNSPRVASKAQGSMTVFPSYLLHRAKPVWRGRREVLVTWLDGETHLR